MTQKIIKQKTEMISKKRNKRANKKAHKTIQLFFVAILLTGTIGSQSKTTVHAKKTVIGTNNQFQKNTNSETTNEIKYTDIKLNNEYDKEENQEENQEKNQEEGQEKNKEENQQENKEENKEQEKPDKGLLVQTEVTIGKGETWKLELKIEPENSIDSFTYSTNNSLVATVDSQGLITGISTGTAAITVFSPTGENAVCNIEVKEAPTGIKLPYGFLTLKRNQTYLLEPEYISGYANRVKYQCSDEKIAVVSDTGEIKAVSSGTAQITVTTYNEVKAILTVQVISGIDSFRFQYVSGKTIHLAKGQSRTLYYAVKPSNALEEAKAIAMWTSNNEKIAVVNKEGKVTGKKPGKAEITLSTTDPNIKPITLTVQVSARKEGTKYSEKDLSIVNTSKALYSYKSMEKDLKDLEKKYGDILHVNVLADTYDDRHIYQVVLGNPNAKKVMVQSAIHAREYMTTQLTMKQIEFYCKNYYTGIYKSQYFSELFDDVAFCIVPMANPDGVTISQYGPSGIRDKTLRQKTVSIGNKLGGEKRSYYKTWKANARGVDLNRNFDQYWEILKNNTPGISSQGFKGFEPASEIETRTLVDMFFEIEPVATISYHSTGSIIYWDYGHKGKFRSESYKLANMAKSLTSYSFVSGFNKYYATGFSDWVSINRKTPAITIEIGKGQCPLGINEFQSIWSRNKLMYLATAKLY